MEVGAETLFLTLKVVFNTGSGGVNPFTVLLTGGRGWARRGWAGGGWGLRVAYV